VSGDSKAIMVEWYANFGYFASSVYRSGIVNKYLAYTTAIDNFAKDNNCEVVTKSGLMRCSKEDLILIKLRYPGIVNRVCE
jgi:hypothetical protein